jgi:hypothetical protein
MDFQTIAPYATKATQAAAPETTEAASAPQ